MAIIIIEPASSGLALIKTAVSAGLEVIIFSKLTPDCEIDNNIRSLAKAVIQVDTLDAKAVAQILSQLHSTSIEAVIPGVEYTVDSTAEAARSLNIPAIKATTQKWVRNKFAMRERLLSCNLAMPKYFQIHCADDLDIAAKTTGFPAVLKPIDGGASICVKRVNNFEELSENYCNFRSIPQMDLGKVMGPNLMLESYLTGPEFSVEGFIKNQQAVIVSITDKILSPEPWFVEIGHIVEANLNSAVKTTIECYIQDVIKHIQLDLGVFHAELRLTDNGPILLEIAARMCGTPVHYLVERAKKFSLPKAMLLAYLGREEEISFNNLHSELRAGILFLQEVPVNFERLKFQLMAYPGVQEVQLYKLREDLSPNLQDNRFCSGHILFEISTEECYQTYIQQLQALLRDHQTQ